MANPAPSAPRHHESGSATASAAETPIASHRPTIDLTALTSRDDFLLELGEALGGQASVHPVDAIDTAIGQLAGTKRGQLLVIDARGSSDVRADVQRVMQQAPHAVVLVFAEAETEKQIASAVKGTSVFAVLTIPIEASKTAAVLDAAIADAVSRSVAARSGSTARASAPTAASAVPLRLDAFRSPASSSAEPPGEPEEGQRKWPLWVGAGLAVVALAAGAGWHFGMGRGTSSHILAKGTIASPGAAASAGAAALPQPAVDTSIVAGHVDDLLEKARRAMRDRRYTAPIGDNAFVYYRSALAADPTNGEAKDGLRRVADVLVSRFNDAMSGSRFPDASLALAALKLAQPSDPHIAPFQLQLSTAEISKAVADRDTDRAAALLRQAQQSGEVPAGQLATWRAELAHLQQDDRIQSLASLVVDRIRSGELTGPAGDSAQAYLEQLHALAPGAPQTERAASALTNAFLGKARESGLSGDRDAESQWLAAARANGASASDVADLERQLESEQAQAAHAQADHLLSLALDRLDRGELTAPAGDSAADYLRQLATSHPAAAGQTAAVQARRELASRLLARARSEMQGGETMLASADLAQARSWGASAGAVATVEQAAESSSPTPQATARPNLAALAAQLKQTHYVAPEYPDRALNDRISGAVTVQYVVDGRGRTRDVHVVEANPPGVFDRAAISAVRRWRYQPAKFNGEPVAVPVQTLIRFELPK